MHTELKPRKADKASGKPHCQGCNKAAHHSRALRISAASAAMCQAGGWQDRCTDMCAGCATARPLQTACLRLFARCKAGPDAAERERSRGGGCIHHSNQAHDAHSWQAGTNFDTGAAGVSHPAQEQRTRGAGWIHQSTGFLSSAAEAAMVAATRPSRPAAITANAQIGACFTETARSMYGRRPSQPGSTLQAVSQARRGSSRRER